MPKVKDKQLERFIWKLEDIVFESDKEKKKMLNKNVKNKIKS